jgi:DNA-binding MarR family transcriptional regulator
MVSDMKSLSRDRPAPGRLVWQFLTAMHRYDAGRTLPILHRAKLTAPQLAVLEFVHVPRIMSAVAAHIGLSRPATSQMIDKLVHRRLVRRSAGTEDRREKTVLLSAKGDSLIKNIARARAARFDASLAALPSVIAATLAATLSEVVDELEKAQPRPSQSFDLMEGNDR